jgi:lipoprotein NlpI
VVRYAIRQASTFRESFIHFDLMALTNRHRMLVAVASILLAAAPFCRGQDPNVAQAKVFYESGTALAGRGDLDGAIAEFSKAIGLDPKNPLAYSARGNAKINTGELEDAIADHTKAIELDPTRRAPYINRGVAKVDKNDLDGAIADYSKAIALDPKGASAYLNRGNARLEKGDTAGARADYEQAIQLAKDEAAYARFALFVLMSRQKTGQPAAELSSLVRRWKPGWKKTLGQFLAGEITEGEFFELSVQGDIKTVREQKCEAFYYSGAVRLIKGDVADARALFEKCVATQLHSFSEFQFARAELSRPVSAEKTKP